MKISFFLLLSILSSNAFAQAAHRDSVAVFHRPEKVIVLVNESGRVGGKSRLQKMMEALGGQNDVLLYNSDQSIKVNCGRSETAVSCTFRFLPSPTVLFGPRKMDASARLTEMQIPEAQDMEVSFESAQQDRFVMSIRDSVMSFHGEKKVLKP